MWELFYENLEVLLFLFSNLLKCKRFLVLTILYFGWIAFEFFFDGMCECYACVRGKKTKWKRKTLFFEKLTYLWRQVLLMWKCWISAILFVRGALGLEWVHEQMHMRKRLFGILGEWHSSYRLEAVMIFVKIEFQNLLRHLFFSHL